MGLAGGPATVPATAAHREAAVAHAARGPPRGGKRVSGERMAATLARIRHTQHEGGATKKLWGFVYMYSSARPKC